MEKVKILNPIKKEEQWVYVIRYFLLANDEYLVYCIPEEYEKASDRINIFVVKLRDKVSITILDSEWSEVFQYLRLIGYSKKEKKELQIEDLDTKKLKGVIVKDFKELSLSLKNLKYFTKEIVEEKEQEPPHLQEAKRVPSKKKKKDYQSLYQEELAKNEILKKRIEDLENLTLTYELNFKQIQDFINEKDFNR